MKDSILIEVNRRYYVSKETLKEKGYNCETEAEYKESAIQYIRTCEKKRDYKILCAETITEVLNYISI